MTRHRRDVRLAATRRQTSPPTALTNCRPIFADLGENVFHVRPRASGHTSKLIGKVFGIALACLRSEAFVAADRAGIDRAMLYEVMSAGSLRSGMMDFVAAFALEGDPRKLAFSIDNGGKDVGYYCRMMDQLSPGSRMGPATRDALAEASSAGLGQPDGAGDGLLLRTQVVRERAGAFAKPAR